MADMTRIEQARFPEDTAALLDIWREYVASPQTSLAYQDNETEFAALPGKYAPPDGCVLIGWRDNKAVATISYRRIDRQICEMKRLYVRPVMRGHGLGRILVEALITAARNAGYSEMRLDVLDEFAAAQKLYAELGFVEAAPVTFNPTPGTRFLGLTLMPHPPK
jgi:putative acetyltransferase